MSKAVNAVKSFFGTDFNFGSIANVLCEYTLLYIINYSLRVQSISNAIQLMNPSPPR